MGYGSQRPWAPARFAPRTHTGLALRLQQCEHWIAWLVESPKIRTFRVCPSFGSHEVVVVIRKVVEHRQ